LFGKDLNTRPLLLCDVCGEEASAHAGDYFYMDPSGVFECCEQPMRLVTKHVTYRAWRPTNER
jgi:hypothetical protein